MKKLTGKLKRDEVKYVRDGVKTLYTKNTECEICGTKHDLQLHHFNTVSVLWRKWKIDNDISIKTAEEMQNYRDDFIESHKKELVTDVITLCKVCHNERLHKVYGQTPALSTAKKQQRWALRQRLKFRGDLE